MYFATNPVEGLNLLAGWGVGDRPPNHRKAVLELKSIWWKNSCVPWHVVEPPGVQVLSHWQVNVTKSSWEPSVNWNFLAAPHTYLVSGCCQLDWKKEDPLTSGWPGSFLGSRPPLSFASISTQCCWQMYLFKLCSYTYVPVIRPVIEIHKNLAIVESNVPQNPVQNAIHNEDKDI